MTTLIRTVATQTGRDDRPSSVRPRRGPGQPVRLSRWGSFRLAIPRTTLCGLYREPNTHVETNRLMSITLQKFLPSNSPPFLSPPSTRK